MLQVTVKTQDSQSREFSVSDDITVQGFKEHIAGSVNVPVDRQRLIYRGRVLQDAAGLNASGDIDGKVVHLVQRIPTAANPTPAELARSGPRLPQPNVQNAAPRPPPPQPQQSAANLLGPFPMLGPNDNFNSQQFVQQMLQQAISGMSSPMGPTIVRGSVRHPNAPGGDSRTEIQIHIAPQGAATSQAGPGGQPRQSAPTNQQPPPPQQGASGPSSQPGPQHVLSEPRRQLNYVERLTTILEEHVTRLESGNLEAQDETNAPNTSGATSTATTSGSSNGATSSEPMDVQSGGFALQTQSGVVITENQSAGERSPSPNAGPPLSRHPSLPDVGKVLKRVTALEERFLPFLTEYTDFLERDPSFTSTESPEYKRMMAFLTCVLRAQRALSIIHRTLSMTVIPLSETPPRTMLIQGDCPRHRSATPQFRRVQNVATAGTYLNRQQGPRVQHRHIGPHAVRGPYQVGMPMFFAPFGPGGPRNMRPGMMPMPQGMFGFGPTPLRPVRPHQSGLYGHPASRPPQHPSVVPPQLRGPFPQQPTAIRSLPPPVAPTAEAPSGATVSTSVPQTTVTSTPRSTTPSSASTHVEFLPAEYAVQVTTHVQPNININIGPGPLPGAAPTAVGEEVGRTEEFVEETGEGGEPMDDGAPPEQDFGFSAGAEEDGNPMLPPLSIPQIPGITREGMRQIITSVQDSVERVMNVMQPQNPGSVTGSTVTQEGAGRFSLQGLPLGPDQIPIEVANIIGQTVQNIVLQHLNVETPNVPATPASTEQSMTTSSSETTTQAASSSLSTSSTSAPPVTETTAVTSAPTPVPTSSPVTTSHTSAAPPTTSAQTSQQASQPTTRNMLAGLLAQINEGQYNSEAAAVASGSGTSPATTTSESTPTPRVLGHAGKGRRKLPPIRRTPNCVNDVVRGQGYPREMMELTGQENIISLVMFLAGELLTIPDCINFMGGAPEPANRLRPPLRRALVECWFDGTVPTREQIEAEVDRQSEEARPKIVEYFGNERPKSPDISIVESNLSLYRHILRRILHLLFVHDAQNFARDILNHMMDCFALVLHLNMHILRGTEEAVVQLVMRQLGSALDPFTMGSSSSGAPDPMVEQVRGLLGHQLIPFARNRPVTQDKIDQFVMNVPSTPESEPAPPKVKETTSEKDANSSETLEKEEETAQDPVKVSNDVSKVEKDEAIKEVKEAASATEPEQTDGARGEADWRSMVPEDWVSVINSDIEKQKNLPEQPPYSDAYMAGMPASKRRKL